MTNSTEPANTRITCSQCQRMLNVPAEAAGRVITCPHCQADLGVFPGPAGPTTPTRSRRVLAVPKQLFGPALALLLFGFAGTLVNGYLALMFAVRPGSDVEFARLRVQQVRSAGALAETKRNADVPEAERPELPDPEAPLSREEEALATAWAPNMLPIHLVGTVLSVLTLTGGFCLLAGRYYPLALLGCIAAGLNVDPICCGPGALAGFWGLLMLIRDDARRHFRRPRVQD